VWSKFEWDGTSDWWENFRMVHVELLWFMTPHSDVVGYEHFGVSFCLDHHFTLKMEVARSSTTLVSYHITTHFHKTVE